MEKKMETTINYEGLYWGFIGVILGLGLRAQGWV